MAHKPIREQFKENVQNHKLFERGSHLIVGISGGADSVCLLKLLSDLRNEFNLTLSAVHINHMLRGEESDADQRFVELLCEKMNTPLLVFKADIKRISEERGISLEEAGRESRYHFFRSVLQEKSADVIAVAHHYDDNAETVMMNILRGCGIEGLTGMAFVSNRVVRPLLNITRKTIEDYLLSEGLTFREDSSNRSNAYFRNRIRNLLFPFIKENLDVDPVSRLIKLSELAKEDHGCLEELAKQKIREIEAIDGAGNVALDRNALNSMHKAIFSRIIRLAWEKINISKKNLERVHVEAIRRLCCGGMNQKELALPGGFQAWLSEGHFWLGRRKKEKKIRFDYPVNIPGITKVDEANGLLKAEVMDRITVKSRYSPEQIKENSRIQIFDYLKVVRGINIRNRRSGDRIYPFRSPGEKKLKDFFIDRKVPIEKRDSIPLVATNQDIIWIIGVRTSQKARADEHTNKYLVLTWIEGDNGGEENE